MKRFLSLGLTILFLLPLGIFDAHAEGTVTRREGFVQMWTAIRRPVITPLKKGYDDVQKGTPGYEEITYAKQRGILDDSVNFFPEDPLSLSEALLWLSRTRNIDDIDDLTVEALPSIVTRLKLENLLEPSSADTSVQEVKKKNLSTEELASLSQSFDAALLKEDHEVSLYSEKFHGKGTAFGETFDMNAMTAAHRTFPHNTLVRVTHVTTGKSVIVRINDRGPFVEGRDMDLSLAAFTALSPRSAGKFRATFERLGDASLVSEKPSVPCEAKVVLQKRLFSGLPLDPGLPRMLLIGKDAQVAAPDGVTLKEIRGPGGLKVEVNHTFFGKGVFTYHPEKEGKYVWLFASSSGKTRRLMMQVRSCAGLAS